VTELAATDLLARVSRVVVGDDGDGCILGRPDLGVYLSVPPPGGVFVTTLQAGGSVSEATAKASQAAGTTVDGQDFLAGLAGAGLLDLPTDTTAGARGRSREIRWIEAVSPATARRLFGRWAWSGYALAAGFSLVVLGAVADLRPGLRDFWWLADPALSVLTLTVISWALGALHEAWHWLAGRAIGVTAIFRISYRGIFLVFETDVSQIATVPRRRRYGVFLAGMAIDTTVLAVALALRLADRLAWLGLPGWLDRLLAMLVLLQLIRLLLQWALLFQRSDGYAVLANALRCHDLTRATWLTTKRRLRRLTGADATELASISPHDQRVARWFGWGYVAGLLAMVWVLLVFVIPFLVDLVRSVADQLLHGPVASIGFWASGAAVAVAFGQYAVIPLLAMRERRLRRAGTLR
jgi:putative peptide zinc metalloprotease protein